MKHLIFEGAELAGKSWIMSEVFKHLEPKARKSEKIMDGCHWFNADNGVFGTENSQGVIEGYMKIFEALKDKNIIVEKFCLTDEIYQNLHRGEEIKHSGVYKQLLELDFKIVLITYKEDAKILKKRIEDRLKLYPHYKDILQDIDWYMNQQQEYKKRIKSTGLSYLTVETDVLPDDKIIKEIISWI